MARHRSPPRPQPTDPLWYVAAVGCVALTIVTVLAIFVGHAISPHPKGVVGLPTTTTPSL